MTRFALTCSSKSVNTLLLYARDIEAEAIPGVKVTIDKTHDIDNPIKAVWLEVETLDALLAVKQTLDLELILTEGLKGSWPGIEIHDDWRE